jgi:hypothetical protein
MVGAMETKNPRRRKFMCLSLNQRVAITHPLLFFFKTAGGKRNPSMFSSDWRMVIVKQSSFNRTDRFQRTGRFFRDSDYERAFLGSLDKRAFLGFSDFGFSQ